MVKARNNGHGPRHYREVWPMPNIQSAQFRVTAQAPNKSLQRAVTDKVLGRGRPSAESTRALRARVLKGRRAAAELNR
jgi:hypothetical protein